MFVIHKNAAKDVPLARSRVDLDGSKNTFTSREDAAAMLRSILAEYGTDPPAFALEGWSIIEE
jgi:hypothetical protein